MLTHHKEQKLRLLPKLELEHITPFSKMSVDMAAQVSQIVVVLIASMSAFMIVTYVTLSESVSKAVVHACGDEATETAHFGGQVFLLLMWSNVHNFSHGVKSFEEFSTSLHLW